MFSVHAVVLHQVCLESVGLIYNFSICPWATVIKGAGMKNVYKP